MTAVIVGVFISLWFVHRKQRAENQRRLEQYWNEQVAYRQSIMSMSNAKKSLLGQGPVRPSLPPNSAILQSAILHRR